MWEEKGKSSYEVCTSCNRPQHDPDQDIWPRPRYMTQNIEYVLDWDICSHTDGILKCPRLWIMPQNNIYPRPRDMSQTLQNIAMFQTHNCWWVWISIESTWIWFVLKRNIVRCYSNLKPNVPLRNCIGSLCSQDLCKWYHTNCGLVMRSSQSY